MVNYMEKHVNGMIMATLNQNIFIIIDEKNDTCREWYVDGKSKYECEFVY